MLGQRFERVGDEVGVVVDQGYLVTTHQVVELLLVDFGLCAGGDDAASSDVVEIVQPLRGVGLDVRPDGFEGLDGLPFQSYIIIIGGVGDGQFGLGVEQPSAVVVRQLVALFVDALQCRGGALAVVVEGAVAGASLADAHLLYVGNEQLYLVVGHGHDGVELPLCQIVLHAYGADEGQMV